MFSQQISFLMLKTIRPSQSFIYAHLDALYKAGKRVLYVGNSCDFYVDRIAASMKFAVHSCDETVIGRAIASCLIDGVNPRPCIDADLKAVFEKWENNRYKPVVEVLFALKIGEYAAQKNDYQKTKYEMYIREADSFYERNIASMERSGYLNFSISSFHSDVSSEFFACANDDAHCLVNLLPVSQRKSQSFCFAERVFASGLEKINSKRKPTIKNYVSAFAEKEFSVISDTLHPELTDFLIGKSKPMYGNKPVFLFSNFQNAPIVFEGRRSIKQPVLLPKIIPHDFVLHENASLSVAKCKVHHVNHYKQLFMSGRVDYSGAGDLGIAFLADGLIFGFASFFQRMRTMSPDRFIFMNSDFVMPSQTARLSKLLLYLLGSQEVRQLVSRQYLFSYASIQTTVFTDKPVSMKYRGVFQKSQKNIDGKLTYIADFTNESLIQRYEKWKIRTKTN